MSKKTQKNRWRTRQWVIKQKRMLQRERESDLWETHRSEEEQEAGDEEVTTNRTERK